MANPPEALTAEAVRYWTERLELAASGFEQDWEIECADADKAVRMLDILEKESLSIELEFALGTLAVASVDELLKRDDSNTDVVGRLDAHLRSNAALHAATLRYWSRVDDHEDTREDPNEP